MECGQQGLGVELGLLSAGRDVAVGHAAGQPGRGGSGCTDVDGDGHVGAVVHCRVLDGVVRALEGHAVVLPERSHERDRLLHALEALGGVGPVEAEGHLVERFTRTDAEDHASRVEHTQGAEGLRDDPRVVPEGGGQHRGAQQDPRRSCADGAEPRQRGGGMSALVHPRLEVVGDEDRVEADLLGEYREIREAGGIELLGGGLVSQAQGNGHVGVSSRGRARPAEPARLGLLRQSRTAQRPQYQR